MTTIATEMRVTKDGMELEGCGRCGGSGRYSWCQMHGDTCFGCGGTGVKLTKRGAVAKAWLESIRSKRVSDLLPGDEILIEGNPFGGKSAWNKIASIEPCLGHKSMVDGVWVEYKDLVTLHFSEDSSSGSYGGLRLSDLKRVRQSPAQHEITRLRGMAFQDTLTKTGKPRK